MSRVPTYFFPRALSSLSLSKHPIYRRLTTSSTLKSEKQDSDLPEELVTPLSQPLSHSPKLIYADTGSETFHTQTTKLSDGLTVTSQSKFGTFCTVGVLVNAGSRHEVSYPSGVSHFLEKMGYSGCSKYKTRDDIMQAVEKLGGICDCQSSRDTTIYAASIDRNKVEDLMELLADVVYQPLLSSSEIDLAHESVNYELEMLDKKPDPDPMMTELIHEAAFRGNTVGLPRFPQPETVQEIDAKVLQTFLRSYYVPSRMVVAGVGVDHDELCKFSEKYVSASAKSPSWSLDGPVMRDESIAQYTGGEVRVEKSFDLSLSVVPMPELAHVSVGMQGVSFTHEDFVPFAVLNMLMGGGGSFSAGGPGKGMFSRLYTNVLNKYHWMFAATAFHHSYEDGGFFCIQASAHPSQLRDCVHVMTQEFAKLTHGTDEIELSRAKKQLQSMLMMNLEARPIIFEDAGRQVLSTGQRKSPQELCDMIEKVNDDDIVRISRHMLSGNPSLAGLGDLRNLPKFSDVQNALTSPDGKLPRKYRFFGN